MAAYLKANMPSEEDFPSKHSKELPGSQGPISDSGRTLWALGAHPKINKIVSYFMGFPGANGVYCLLKGLEHKFKKTGVKGKVITTEVNPEQYNAFLAFLKTEKLEEFIEIQNSMVQIDSPPLCDGKIDLFAEDADGGTPFAVHDNLFNKCDPTYYISENTGGIGANHAYKHDYQDTIPEDHIIIKDKESMMYDGECGRGCGGVAGRKFSMYARPMAYSKITHFQYPRDDLLFFYHDGPGAGKNKGAPQYRRRAARDRL